jgi:hypothetical protein
MAGECYRCYDWRRKDRLLNGMAFPEGAGQPGQRGKELRPRAGKPYNIRVGLLRSQGVKACLRAKADRTSGRIGCFEWVKKNDRWVTIGVPGIGENPCGGHAGSGQSFSSV